MMRVSYVRFKNAVMAPGRGGNTIAKAKLRTDETTRSTPRDELMDDMVLEDGVLTMLAVRVDEKGQKYVAKRCTDRSNCVDWEEHEEASTKTKGK